MRRDKTTMAKPSHASVTWSIKYLAARLSNFIRFSVLPKRETSPRLVICSVLYITKTHPSFTILKASSSFTMVRAIRPRNFSQTACVWTHKTSSAKELSTKQKSVKPTKKKATGSSKQRSTNKLKLNTHRL